MQDRKIEQVGTTKEAQSSSYLTRGGEGLTHPPALDRQGSRPSVACAIIRSQCPASESVESTSTCPGPGQLIKVPGLVVDVLPICQCWCKEEVCEHVGPLIGQPSLLAKSSAMLACASNLQGSGCTFALTAYYQCFKPRSSSIGPGTSFGDSGSAACREKIGRRLMRTLMARFWCCAVTTRLANTHDVKG